MSLVSRERAMQDARETLQRTIYELADKFELTPVEELAILAQLTQQWADLARSREWGLRYLGVPVDKKEEACREGD